MLVTHLSSSFCGGDGIYGVRFSAVGGESADKLDALKLVPTTSHTTPINMCYLRSL